MVTGLAPDTIETAKSEILKLKPDQIYLRFESKHSNEGLIYVARERGVLSAPDEIALEDGMFYVSCWPKE